MFDRPSISGISDFGFSDWISGFPISGFPISDFRFRISDFRIWVKEPRMVRLIQFEHDGRIRVGVEVVNNGDIFDITAVDSGIPADMKSLLAGGDSMLERVSRCVVTYLLFFLCWLNIYYYDIFS